MSLPKEGSPMMARIREMARKLPPVIDPKISKECFDQAWEDYLKTEARLKELGWITEGNRTIIRPVSPEAADEINEILGF